MKKTRFLILLFVLLNTQSVLGQKTILWEVKKPSSSKVSYLLGTYHQTGNSFIDKKPVIKELLLKSEVAIFESVEDRNEKIISVMNARADDFSYRTLLGPSNVAFLENYSSEWAVPISKQKPAELLAKLQQKYVEENCGTIKPTDLHNHMDDYLMEIAQNHHNTVLGLETYSEQINAINTTNDGAFTWDKAKEPVHYWVESIQTGKNKKDICAIAHAYLEMKFDYQFDVKCAENNALLSNRNEKWMPTILKNISTHNSFIIVGLFHLYGECGIISQLRKQGYEVNPVYIK